MNNERRTCFSTVCPRKTLDLSERPITWRVYSATLEKEWATQFQSLLGPKIELDHLQD